MRKAVVMLNAGYLAILATVLLIGDAYAYLDSRDFPDPVSDLAVALAGGALYLAGIGLATLVKNEALGDRVLGVLAAANALVALLLAVWALAASGFSQAGHAVVWITVGVLLAMASAQALARGSR